MIITTPKKMGYILEKIAAHDELAIIGCGLCATACQTGGEREVTTMATALSGQGKKILWTEIIDGVCQKQLTRRTLSRRREAEAILTMACGSGVQTVAGLSEKPVYPALDSQFLGSIIRVGQFEEKCSLCGSCVVDEFAGICPITLCPKKILNGPCGGMEDGKCETDSERDCAWYRIFLSKETAGCLKNMEKIFNPRSHRRPSSR